MNMDVEYIQGDVELLHEVGSLWEKLNEHHKNNSKHFKEKYSKFTFKDRKKGLIKKSANGKLKVCMAKIENEIVGYCISSINDENVGEIESIYVEPKFRSFRIGDKLITSSLKWMDESKVSSKIIGVSAGNEKVFGFYERYGFYPSVTILKRPLGR